MKLSYPNLVTNGQTRKLLWYSTPWYNQGIRSKCEERRGGPQLQNMFEHWITNHPHMLKRFETLSSATQQTLASSSFTVYLSAFLWGASLSTLVPAWLGASAAQKGSDVLGFVSSGLPRAVVVG